MAGFEIGRISGPLLKSDLLRQGVDLAFENDLLYLKVSEANKANHRIGIKTSNPDPNTALDINGTAKSKKLVVTDKADIGNLKLESSTITATQGNLILKPALILDKVNINDVVSVAKVIDSDKGKVDITGDVLIMGNLHATGAITADGDLTLGDNNTDNIVFAADINSDILPNITDTYNLGSTEKRWRSTFQQKLYVGDILIENDTLSNVKSDGNIILTANGSGIIKLTSYTKVESDLEVLGKIILGTDDSVESTFDTVTDTVNIVNTTATKVNFAGAGIEVNIGAATGTTNIKNNLDVDGDVDVDGNVNIDGDLEIKGEDLTTDKSTFNLLNTTATTVNFAGAGTTVNIGASLQGTTNVKNDLDVDGVLEIKSGDLTTNQTTFNLANTTATTVNFAGSGTTVNIGASLQGTTNVKNDLDVDGVLEIKSGDLTTNQTTFNLANTTATTVNFAGAATNIEIGSSTGTTNVNNDLDVDGDVKIDGGDLKVSTSVFNLANDTATTVNFAGDATNVQIGSDEGDTNVNNNLTVDGVTNVQKELTVEGDTTVNSRLTVEGIVDVNNSLYVTGSTDLSESLNVQGSTSVQRELVVEGNTQMNKSLAVEGELKAGKLVDTIIDCGEY